MPADWFVVGVDPLKRHILVKCRLTRRTGFVADAALAELERAGAQSFEPYPWIEPLRVTPHAIKPEVMKLSQQTQRLSGILRKSQSLTLRVE
jgi:hypothetical protein